MSGADQDIGEPTSRKCDENETAIEDLSGFGKGSNDEEPDELPVEAYKHKIIDAIRSNPFLICVGETGSGKTTKIPQYCLDYGLVKDGCCVGITQPRRVAAITVASRVAEERNSVVGDEVGYSVRFDDRTSKKTRIKYLTDGVLVRELLFDPLLTAYSIVVLDEAHERSIHTDILFALTKSAVDHRKGSLRVIITSATLDVGKFKDYFGARCALLEVPGRLFPVDIFHSKNRQIMTAHGPASMSYVDAAVNIALKIHFDENSLDGHILIFLTGSDEIELACQKLRQAARESSSPLSSCRSLYVLPLYASLPVELQKKVFMKAPAHDAKDVYVRKCVVATNIAETSVTVPHVRYVIDAGFVKQKAFDPTRRIESLIVVPVSQVSANQRAGRAGRTCSGQCYRLYSSDSYNDMMAETVPEILRSNLSNVILYLKTLNIVDVLAFDYMERPDPDQIAEALTELHLLQAIDNNGIITPDGRLMSTFPVDPTIARMLVTAASNNCFLEMAAIAAMLSAENIWLRKNKIVEPHDEVRDPTNQGSKQFAAIVNDSGDFFTFLQIFYQFLFAASNNPLGAMTSDSHSARAVTDKSHQRDWCQRNGLSYRSLVQAVNIWEQLIDDAVKANVIPSSVALSRWHHVTDSKAFSRRFAKIECALLEAISSGLFMNAARKCGESLFRPIPLQFPLLSGGSSHRSTESLSLLHVHPSSAVANSESACEYVVYQSLQVTSRLWMKNVQSVVAHDLRKYRTQWRPTHPAVLSGQPIVAVVETTKASAASSSTETGDDIPNDKKRERESESGERKKLAAISAAKARYLARKS